MAAVKSQIFTVFVDDNFHYMDEDERSVAGEFRSYEDAVNACKEIVERSLQHALSQKPPMTADQLYSHYTDFGNDPFVSPMPPDEQRFSAWSYAKDRCQALCASRPEEQ
ncbi:MAG: hypothetical protein KGS72_29000 [Cyanobacteria bacterium REEB67]|nr:hypothetical protein [Cyanobacteria bacterium REEB67]